MTSPDDGRDLRTGWLRLALLVARRDYVRTVQRRGFIFGTLLLPLGVALLLTISGFFSLSGSDGPQEVDIVVVNESGLDLSDAALRVPGFFLLPRVEAERRLTAGSLDSFYVVPATYPTAPGVLRVEAEQGPGISAIETDSAREALLTVVLQDALLRSAGMSAEAARQVHQGITVTAISVDGSPVSDIAVAASIVVPILFVSLFMISIFITSGYLLQSVTEEKENRVVEIVLSSVPSLPLMGGKIMGLGAAGLTQVVIWLITAFIALPLIADRIGDIGDVAPSPTMLGLAVVYFVLGYLAYGAIFAAIGAVAPGNREAQQYSGFFGFVAAIPFVLLAGFFADLSSIMVIALCIFPLTAPTAMLLVLGLAPEVPWELVGASLVSLVLFVLLATVAAGRIFRATVLLYGVRPSLPRILSAMRSPR